MIDQFVDALAVHRVPVSLAIITFTESRRGCFVSLKEFRNRKDIQANAKTYVSKIEVRAD